MKTIAAVALSVLCSAAAAQSPTTGPATCAVPEHCDIMMAAAVRYVQSATGMRLRLSDKDRAETFVANDYGRMTGVVVKEPIGAGVFVFIASFSCYRGTNCAEQRASAKSGFHEMMRAEAKFLASIPAPAPAASAP